MLSSWWWLPWVAIASAAALVPAVLAWRRGRRASAVRWLGWATVPWAAWLLGLVSLVARVSDAFGDWAARFVFNPAAWTGLLLALVALCLIVGGGRLARRAGAEPAKVNGRGPTRAVARATEPAEDDIEAILRKHGIS
jgi:hypothetical protein